MPSLTRFASRIGTVAAALALLAVPGYAQDVGTITGRVIDGGSQQPVAGAQIVVEGTLIGGLTQPSGLFSLPGVPAGTHTVRVELIGYQSVSQEVTVIAGQTANVEFALNVNAVLVEEVIAIGYGTARRRDVAGAIGSVSADQLMAGRASPTTSIAQTLLGRSPGVQVMSNVATPGRAAEIRIRGTNSITANSNPLYVVDGIPLTAQGQGLIGIDPNNIESIQILKDASATAIYGARGANGVVLITTARGSPGTNQITLETSYGVQRPTKFIEALSGPEFMELVNEGRRNAGLPEQFSQSEIANATSFDYPRALLQNLAWQPQVNHSLTFSGGDGTTRYLVSGTFTNQHGVVINSGFKRYSARVNLDRNVGDRVRIGASLSGTRSIQAVNGSESTGTGAGSTGLTAAIMYDPTVPPVDPVTGQLNQRVVLNENFNNPYNESLYRNQPTFRTGLLASVFGEWDILPGLTVRSTLGANLNFNRNKSYSPSFIATGQEVGVASQSSSEGRDLTNENILTYNREMGPGNLQAMVGASIQTSTSENISITVRDFAVDALEYFNLGAAAASNPPTSSYSESVLISQLGRLHYSLLDRYLFTFTMRRDGSSRFGANNKWAAFPSAAFAWRLIDEAFMANQSLFSDLRFRVSFGRTGNQAIGIGETLARLDVANTALGTDNVVITLLPSSAAPNPDLKWETQDQYNVGFDFGLFQDRVSLTIDAYQSDTKNLLLSRGLPWTSGFASQLQNVGRVRNRGAELSLSTINVQTEKFFWETTFTAAANRNEVVELYDGLESLGAGSSTQVGEPLGTFVGYKVLGLYQEGDTCELLDTRLCAPGEYRILDFDGNGVINNDDRVNLGSPEATVYGGLRTSIRYGPFTAEAFLNYSYGNKINNSSMRYLGLVGGAANERADRARKRWTPNNTNTDVPRANILRDNNRTYSTYIEDGSFLRLQMLSFGYQLPAELIPGVNSARLIVTGQNLWITTDYSGYDPENGANDPGRYPRNRAWNVGLNVTF